ncbi:DUF397 domain-containing protein [Streptomyces sp. DSM 44917]|uniref:DUF397 domain-containing protein n=1 Tax=Streptomyces boetiae TaxID=3075541 RepID=A0ABU2L1P1_9ACTN|nr:DUF397 domain-containing protein [Streptomyces sp. DSM 44917]MDT0305445.1 DUF397 domain-containing protein [Streptomyces sp. DSM 44917]
MSTALTVRTIQTIETTPPAAPLVPPGWQRSSFSGGTDNCVELAHGRSGGLLLRESDAPLSVVATSRRRLAALLGGVKSGRFDRLAGQGLAPPAGERREERDGGRDERPHPSAGGRWRRAR